MRVLGVQENQIFLGKPTCSHIELWKVKLQKFADATGLNIHVRHFLPGTSKIEHRLPLSILLRIQRPILD